MDDITRALAAAWKQVRPRLARDEAELRRRLTRRLGQLLKSPPRAWCLALRANDTRLKRTKVGSTELGGVSPASASLPTPDSLLPISLRAHQLTIDSTDLAQLCSPVHICRPGEPLADVARKLGVTRGSLLVSRQKKIFSVRHDPCLAGRWGSPHPILYTDQPLDPATRGFSMPDPLFSFTAPHYRDRIPPGIRATLTRVPIFHDATRAYRDTQDLHPEHPAVDRSYDPRRRNKSRALPPPQPDTVWYKWRGDEFIGYDWRAAESNPRIKASYERHQRELARYRDYNRNRRPRRSTAGGSLKFRGWSWLCPHCHRRAQVLFYPLPRMALIQWKTLKIPADLKALLHPKRRASLPLPARGERAVERVGERGRLRDASNNVPAAETTYPRIPGFACQKCHRLRRFSWASKGTWGEIVCYLSAGLLYGHEVQRPPWFVPKRKNQYAPKPNRPPARRPQPPRAVPQNRPLAPSQHARPGPPHAWRRTNAASVPQDHRGPRPRTALAGVQRSVFILQSPRPSPKSNGSRDHALVDRCLKTGVNLDSAAIGCSQLAVRHLQFVLAKERPSGNVTRHAPTEV